MTAYFSWEAGLLLWLQSVRNDFLSPILKLITHLGDKGLFWILLALVLIAIPRARRIGLIAAGALIFSFLINNIILKHLVNRIRPYELIEGLQILVGKPGDASFPSGHTGTSLAASWAIFRSSPKKYGIPLVVLALLISFSRLYVGVHFPTDVLAGLVTGLLSGELAFRLVPAAITRLLKRAEK